MRKLPPPPPPPYLQFISKEESFQGIDSVLARHNEGNNPRLVKTSIKAKLNESDPRTNEHSQLLRPIGTEYYSKYNNQSAG